MSSVSCIHGRYVDEGEACDECPPAEPCDDCHPAVEGLIDWSALFARETPLHEWLAEPIIPGGGRSTVIYADKGKGKSDLLLWIATRLVLGLKCFDTKHDRPLRILYIDNEMTEADLLDRLETFLVTEADIPLLTENLFYYLLPTLAPLDTATGAEQLLGLVDLHQPDLVIVDTITRALSGDENDAGPVKELGHRVTKQLKRKGINVVYSGHSGKDLDRGQRGTSEYGGFDELIWQFKRPADSNEVTLTATKKRGTWIPVKVQLARHERVDSDNAYWALPAPTTESPHLGLLIAKLHDVGLPQGLSVRAAQKWMRDHGHTSGKTDLFTKALKAHNSVSQEPGNAAA